jgi:6-phosphogluconolactonase
MSAARSPDAKAAAVRAFANPEALARGVAQWLLGVVRERGGSCAICLSGGSTPRRLYEVLAVPPIVTAFPWDDVHWFWGDERFVPPDHPDSNFRMVEEALLSVAPVPRENIHPIPTEGSLADAAAAYETVLKNFYGEPRLDPARPLFDVTLFGLGEDGHTASLFPGSPVLAERERWVVDVVRPGAPGAAARITLTYPALDSSRIGAFLVAGARKREILARVLAGDRTLPAAQVNPVGDRLFFADRAATPA